MTGASFAATPAIKVRGDRRFAADQGAVPDGDDDRRRRRSGLVEDLGPDRAVAFVLRRLRPVLEEREAPFRREGGGLGFGLVEVAAPKPDLAAASRDQLELGAGGLLGREDRCGKPEEPRRPGGRRAMITGRGRDDPFRSPRSVRFEGGKRAAPLEGAELVPVLPFEKDVAPASQGIGRFLQGSR
jgi:hypothetical protein